MALALLALGCGSLFGPRLPARPVLDPDRVQRGALLFLDASLSPGGGRSCASCHPGGASDGRAYLDGVAVAAGTTGAVDTPSLRGAWQTPPYLWHGSAPTLRTALERMLRVEMRGAVLPEADLVALEHYVASLEPFDRGRVAADGSPIEPVSLRARRGAEVFAKVGCVGCHPAPAFTRARSADVGTGGRFDIPTLRGIATTAPYAHDGRWSTLDEAVRAHAARDGGLEEFEIECIVEYLKLL